MEGDTMLEKIKGAIDHILGLPGTKEEKEMALILLNLNCILGLGSEGMDVIEKMHAHIRSKGVTLECFAPSAFAAFI